MYVCIYIYIHIHTYTYRSGLAGGVGGQLRAGERQLAEQRLDDECASRVQQADMGAIKMMIRIVIVMIIMIIIVITIKIMIMLTMSRRILDESEIAFAGLSGSLIAGAVGQFREPGFDIFLRNFRGNLCGY